MTEPLPGEHQRKYVQVFTAELFYCVFHIFVNLLEINHNSTYIAQINEDTLIVDQISFVAFSCKSVNVSVQQKRKSDGIKTIVQAAVEILGFK